MVVKLNKEDGIDEDLELLADLLLVVRLIVAGLPSRLR